MKEKISASSSLEGVNDDVESEDPIETNSERSTPLRLAPLPMKATRAAHDDEEWLLRAMETREKQSMAFQTKVMEMLAPSKSTDRTAYADRAKEVMVSFHPSLWLKFRRECNNLLYTYHETSEELFQTIAQQQCIRTIGHFSRYTSRSKQSTPVPRLPALLPTRCGSDLPHCPTERVWMGVT